MTRTPGTRSSRRSPMTLILLTATTALTLTLGPSPSARAGARILCDVIDIGAAPSLPWRSGAGWDRAQSDYPAASLVPDTLRLLAAGTPVLVRMETLRRATIYARAFSQGSEARVGRELAWRLVARALAAEAQGKPDALAWFDAGYFSESLEQWDPEWVKNVDGYGFVLRASALRGADPEIELGAMIITGESPRKPGRHFEKVRAASGKHPQLARGLAQLFPAVH